MARGITPMLSFPSRLKTVVAVALSLTGVGCVGSDSPEAHVRATIDAMEIAAEERDVGDLMEHVSAEFRDAQGRGAKELSQYIRGYFIANQSIHLLTRVDRIEFPTTEEARAQVTVGMVGRDAGADAWSLAAEVHDFDVTFMLDDGEWKVTYARVRSGAR